MKVRLLILVSAVWLSGCGYALVGRGNFLPAGVETVQVPTFTNRTTRVEMEQLVTQAVAEEMVLRGRLRLVSSDKDAHLILRGSVNSFGINPVSFNAEGRATEYQAVITASIELVDHRAEDAVIWKNDHYRFVQSYPIDAQAFDLFDQETAALGEIAQRFAQSLVTNLLEGF